MTSKLTRERIELIANFHRAMTLPPSHAEIEELARMALAAMDSETVAYMHDGEDGTEYNGHDEFSGGGKGIPLYRHAQPVPVVSVDLLHTAASAIEDLLTNKDRTGAGVWFDLPFRLRSAANEQTAPVVDADDNFYSWFGREWAENYQHNQYTTAAKQMLGVMAESAWKAGRHAAMLAAAPQSPGSEPATVPGKWIPVSERKPEESGRYWCYVEEQNDLGKSHYQWNCSWNGERWWVESENGGIVTHWIPLPAVPQEVNRE